MAIRNVQAAAYLILMFTLTVLMAACSSGQAIEPLETGDVERGRMLFSDRNRTRCEGCHSLDGSTSRAGPSMLGISELAEERVPGMTAAEYLRQSILDPTAFIVPSYGDNDHQMMQPYTIAQPDEEGRMAPGTLTADELNDLIAFLLTQ